MSKRSATNTRWSEAIEHLRSVDSRWHVRIEKVGPCLLTPRRDRFGTLVKSIVSQQISTKAAASIEMRLRALGQGSHDPHRLLALEIEALRSVGLSAMKVDYLRSLAEHVATGRLPLHQAGRWTDERVIERLTEVRGIGRWTAEMFLIFALNRPDVMSVGDLGIRAGIQRHFDLAEMPDPATCLQLAEPWRPHRTVAMWYLWREKDTW
jgi:DNA-3-methyladenine glycosylase II